MLSYWIAGVPTACSEVQFSIVENHHGSTDFTVLGDDTSADVYDSFIDAWHQGATLEECLEEAQSMNDSMKEVEEDIPAAHFGLVGLFRKICD